MVFLQHRGELYILIVDVGGPSAGTAAVIARASIIVPDRRTENES